MGQKQTKSSDVKSGYVKSLRSEKMRYMKGLNYIPEESNSCCRIGKPKPSPEIYDSQWKRNMIQQLMMMQVDDWPARLQQILKDNKDEDNMPFQTEIYLADFNSSNDINHFIKDHSGSVLGKDVNSGKGSEKNSLVVVEENDSKKSLADNMQNLVSSLVETSDILDEKFYEDHNRPTWMNKSFDIRAPDPQPKVDSFIFAMENNTSPTKSKKSSFSTMTKQPTGAKSKTGKGSITSISSRISNIPEFEAYKNNTFVNHIPVPENPGLTKMPSDNMELYHHISKYKTLTEMIDRHIKIEKNIFCKLLKNFTTYFQNKYENLYVELNTNKKSIDMAHADIMDAIFDLQQFIRLLFEGINQFYRLDKLRTGNIPGKDNMFNRDNMINFVTSMVFTDKLYKIIFGLIYQFEKKDDEAFEKNLRSVSKLKPEDFGIPEEYCLNEKTIQILKQKGQISEIVTYGSITNTTRKDFAIEAIEEGDERNEETFQENNSITKELQKEIESDINKSSSLLANGEESNHDINRNSSSANREVSEESKDTSQEKIITSKPFQKAIDSLSNLVYRKSPIHKLKTIVKVAELITVCIEEFYVECGASNLKKLDADETLAIFMYIVAKSGITKITSHCKVIEKFSTNNVLHSVSGYYATTLEACVTCITSMVLKNESNIDDLKSSVKNQVQNYSLLQRVSNQHSLNGSVLSDIKIKDGDDSNSVVSRVVSISCQEDEQKTAASIKQ